MNLVYFLISVFQGRSVSCCQSSHNENEKLISAHTIRGLFCAQTVVQSKCENKHKKINEPKKFKKFDWKWNDECVNDRREPLNSINLHSFTEMEWINWWMTGRLVNGVNLIQWNTPIQSNCGLNGVISWISLTIL